MFFDTIRVFFITKKKSSVCDSVKAQFWGPKKGKISPKTTVASMKLVDPSF